MERLEPVAEKSSPGTSPVVVEERVHRNREGNKVVPMLSSLLLGKEHCPNQKRGVESDQPPVTVHL